MKIKDGYTNNSYKRDDLFFQEKKINNFNHKIDYFLLQNFDFVPKLIENKDDILKYEWIEKVSYIDNSPENLKKIAYLMKQIHNSKLPFPASNHAARIKEYLKIINNKGLKIPVLNKYYKKINLILRNMDKNTPLHNDLYDKNILIDKENKMWIIDWEYASKGDKHFDLAYFIESARLNDEQETILLDAYDDYNYEHVLQHRILVLYLIILWINMQDVKPFDDKEFHHKIEFVNDLLQKRKLNNK